MLRLTNTRLFAFTFLLLVLVGFTACDKDDDTSNDGRVQLLSFGPTGAKHGDTLRFFGNNLNMVTEVAFTGNNAVVKQAEFKQQTAKEILLVVPQAAEQGVVALKSAQGDVVSKTQFNLNVTTQVTGISAEARPGSDITLSGSYLNWVKSISFAKGKVVTSFVSKAFDKLVVKVPADAETGPLVIAYAGTDSAEFETADTVRVILPVATGFAPSPVKHADNLTINGTDLDLTEKVGFAGVATPITEFVSKTATQLVVKVPAGAQKGKVTLMPASGVASVSAMDMEVLLPAVTGFAPSPVDPNTNLTINGTNLDLVTTVTFQNAAPVTAFVSQSASRLVVRVPNGVLRGKVVLGVRNSSLTVESGDVLEIAGAVPPPTLAFPIYSDAVTTNWTGNSGWIGGGWGGSKNYDNTTPVREGSKSVKIDYVGGYGAPVQLGGANISLAQYRNFKLSVFGAPGSAGKTITVGINGTNGKFNITVVEGKWTDYSVPLTTLTSETVLKEIWVQEFSGTGGFTVYVDAMGLD